MNPFLSDSRSRIHVASRIQIILQHKIKQSFRQHRETRNIIVTSSSRFHVFEGDVIGVKMVVQKPTPPPKKGCDVDMIAD